MATKDGVNGDKLVTGLAPQAVTTTVAGTGVDTQGFSEVTLICIGDGTAVGELRLEESDASGSGYTAVAAGDVIGTNPSGTDNITASATIAKIGYLGTKRYVRANWAVHTTSGDIAAVFKLGCASVAPVSGDA